MRREKDTERKTEGKSESEITSKWQKKWKQKAKGNGGEVGRRTAEGGWGGLWANDVDEMLLSGEHVTRPRRIEINAFASRIPAPSPFPLLSSRLLPCPS